MHRLAGIALLPLLAAAVVSIANGCSSSGDAPVLGGPGASVPVSGPCAPEGALRECHVNLDPNGVVPRCAIGVQTCAGGTWSPCGAPGGATDAGAQDSATSGLVPVRDSTASVGVHVEDAKIGRDRLASIAAMFARATIPAPSFVLDASAPDLPSRFERLPSGAIRPVLRADARARLTLPEAANGRMHLEDARSRVAIDVAIAAARPVAAAPAGGLLVYPAAIDGADLVHRASTEGTEDYVAFARRPAREELRYDVALTRVAAVRLVSSTIELLDEAGVPRLRVAPPSLVDAAGRTRAARVAVEGCAIDTNPAAPWRHRAPPPGSDRCVVRVTWDGDGLAYPILVDPAWTTTGSMAAPREFHSASFLPVGDVLVAGGRANGTYLSSAELYDPASGAFAATGAMATPRGFHYAASYGAGVGLVLVGGGANATGVLASAEVYDASTGLFHATDAMDTARYSARAVVLSSTTNVLVTGGYDALGGPLASAEYYDVNTNQFTTVGSMTHARAYHAVAEYAAGKVVITGGTDGATVFSSAEIYQEASQSFTAVGDMLVGRARHTATLLPSGKVLVAGGWDGGATSLASASLFDPSSMTFAATGSMATPRGHHVARLVGTNVVVAGGISGSTPTATAEVYHPTTAAFTSLPNMNAAREFLAGAVLASSKMLVIGGNGGSGDLASAEVLASLDGGPCSAGADCVSGTCNDGICCASAACTGPCTTCTPGTGACQTLTAQTDPDTCNAPSWCNALGQCAPIPSACANDPCDPYCQAVQTDAGPISTPASAGGAFFSAVGLGATPGGFDMMEECNPCTGPFPATCGSFTHYNTFDACESDYHCDTTSQKCVQSTAGFTWPSSVCPGVDLTVEASCATSTQYVFPVCNRGNTAVPAGKTLAFYIVNGNQWSVDPNACPTLPTTCTYTLATPLLPGTCQPVDTCAWAGNAIVYANADNAIAECPAPAGPGCGDNWADIKAGAGSCQSVGAYTPTTVTYQYVATCGPNTHVQWSALTYSTTVSSNTSGSSDVKFQAQTAPITSATIGTFGALTTVADAVATDPAVCQAPCSVNLYAKLGGPPTATNEALNLTITIAPTPDGQASGTLQTFQLTYDCVPSQ